MINRTSDCALILDSIDFHSSLDSRMDLMNSIVASINYTTYPQHKTRSQSSEGTQFFDQFSIKLGMWSRKKFVDSKKNIRLKTHTGQETPWHGGFSTERWQRIDRKIAEATQFGGQNSLCSRFAEGHLCDSIHHHLTSDHRAGYFQRLENYPRNCRLHNKNVQHSNALPTGQENHQFGWD